MKLTPLKPTAEQIQQAAERWFRDACGEGDPETHIEYFERNWQTVPGLREYVERL